MKLGAKLVVSCLLVMACIGMVINHQDVNFRLEVSMQTGDARSLATCLEDSIVFGYNQRPTIKGRFEVEEEIKMFFLHNKCKAFKIADELTYIKSGKHIEGIYETVDNQRFRMCFEGTDDKRNVHRRLSKMVIEKMAAR